MSRSDSEGDKTPKENHTTKPAPAPIIIQSESSSFNAGIILDETNYDMWSQIMEMHLAEKEKLSFVRGCTQPPTEKDDGYEKWYTDNQKVKRWLLMSMSPDIMKRYIRLKTARDIWKALSKAFYDGADELQVFTLNQRAFSSKQNGKSVSVYYGELIEIFSELDHRDKVIMECEKDVAAYHKSIQRQRVHIFLALSSYWRDPWGFLSSYSSSDLVVFDKTHYGSFCPCSPWLKLQTFQALRSLLFVERTRGEPLSNILLTRE
jgi:hypothetical protein